MTNSQLIKLPEILFLGDYYKDKVAYALKQVEGNVLKVENCSVTNWETLSGTGTFINAENGSEFVGYCGENGRSFSQHFLLIFGKKIYSTRDEPLHIKRHTHFFYREFELWRKEKLLYRAKYRFPVYQQFFQKIISDHDEFVSLDFFDELCNTVRSFAPHLLLLLPRPDVQSNKPD